MNGGLSRREMLRASLIGVGAAALGGMEPRLARGQVEVEIKGLGVPAGKPFRVVHLTDTHVQPELKAGEGFAAALAHIAALKTPADLILTGGDHVMDIFKKDVDRAKVQWDLYDKVLADSGIKTPIKSCLGNHDILGWGGVPGVDEKTAGYGKAIAIDKLKLPGKTYHSFDAGGWHFVSLDSVTQRGTGYYGELDKEQTEWLAGDLKGTTLPTLVLSHIPILAACTLFDGKPDDKDNSIRVSDALMHKDGRALVKLFAANKVKLAISGHIHQVDRIDFKGISFLCNGAVSGAWWKGPNEGFPEGYAVLDLFPDGTFKSEYVAYGWKAEVPPAKVP